MLIIIILLSITLTLYALPWANLYQGPGKLCKLLAVCSGAMKAMMFDKIQMLTHCTVKYCHIVERLLTCIIIIN